MELKVRNINKEFNSENGFAIFQLNISELKFPLGKVIYILGHNGSGKSLFVQLLNNEITPTNGQIKILEDNKEITNTSNLISIVRQKIEENLCLEQTIEENIILRLNPTTFKEKVFPKKYLNSVALNSIKDSPELTKKFKQSCSELSGGQKQTLAFYVGTMNKSKLLVLDEFLSSTDFQTSLLLRQKAKDFAQLNNSAVVIISHDIQTALNDSDLIYIFENGKLKTTLDRKSENWSKEFIIKQVNTRDDERSTRA